jgi:hypothetical protein
MYFMKAVAPCASLVQVRGKGGATGMMIDDRR